MPMTAVVIVANVLAGRASSWLGAGPPIVAGQVVFAIGCFFLLAIDANTRYQGLWWQLVLIGAGIGLTVRPMTSALLATVDKPQSGVASGVLNTTRQIGSVIGVALFGSLIANRNRFITGMHFALCLSAILVLVGAVAAFVMIGTMRSSPRNRKNRQLVL